MHDDTVLDVHPRPSSILNEIDHNVTWFESLIHVGMWLRQLVSQILLKRLRRETNDSTYSRSVFSPM